MKYLSDELITRSIGALFVILAGFGPATLGQAPVSVGSQSNYALLGVRIKVPDIEEAKRFYIGTLRFGIDKEELAKKELWLRTNAYKIVLQESKEARRITTPGYSDVSMSMRVNDIDETFKTLKAAGVRFIKDEKRKEGVGWSLQILDPFGNKISMMQITVGRQETIAEPSVYNCGVYVTDIEKALVTYRDQLGFTVRSRAYMPEDMPLGTADGKFAFMLHLRRADFPHIENPNVSLIFSTNEENAFKRLRRAGASIKKAEGGNVLVITDTVGVRSELVVDKPA